MKYSQLFLKTLKESPSDETSRNADLLVRAGYIYKTMAGVYSFLPLGLRVLENIAEVVRDEMDALGGSQMLMPALCPKENWDKTGRWDQVDVLYKVPTAGDKEVALCPTHEEVVTPLVQQFAQSPKDFPFCVYQIQTKFRNEPRAKSGILRGREFMMKDAYSFHLTQECFDAFYEKSKEAYKRVYERLGIGDITYLVAASGGDFSKYSHEFQTLSEVGEDDLFYDKKSDTWYNKEIAPAKAPAIDNTDETELPREDVKGENIIGVEPLAEFLKIPVEKTTKTMLFETDKGKVVAVAVRGGYDVNDLKVKEIVDCKTLQLASEETVKRVTGSEVGYAGPLGLPKDVFVIWDESTQGRKNFECGANQTHHHSINVNFGRDIDEPKQFYDVKVAKPGDTHPETGTVYEVKKAVEVGNIFPLANKFSKSFNFKIEGKDVLMGCYGIGISRTMGVLAEVFNDEKGLKWPAQVAPFEIYLAAIGKDDEAYKKAEEIYEQLQDEGFTVLYDDRRDKKIGPGQKFADHELIGLPYRVVVSERNLEAGVAEVVSRETGDIEMITFDTVGNYLEAHLN